MSLVYFRGYFFIRNHSTNFGIVLFVVGLYPSSYLVGFAVTDYAGNDNDSYVEVTIK